MKLHTVTFILLIVGGLNWGLVGLGALMDADWNVVNMVLGRWMMLESIVYLLVGLSAVYEVFSHKKFCRNCSPGGAM